MDKIYTIEQLAALLPDRTAASIRTDLSRNPCSLPPHFKAPGGRRWLFTGVEQWVQEGLRRREIELEARRLATGQAAKRRRA